MKKLNESVLDPIQKTRCEALFDPNDTSKQPVMLPDTKAFIIGLLNKFREETGLQFNYTEAFIVGSSLGYQYKDDSDIDVDVRVDLGKSFFKGKYHFIPKNVMLPGTAHPINIFLLTKEDPPYNFEKDAENAYDLLTDTWIKQSVLSNETVIPYEYISGVSEFIMDGMALELHRSERDMHDMEKYLSMDPNRVAITIKDRNDAISKKISDLIIDKDALALAHTFMFRLDRDGFNDDAINVSIKYTFQSRHYSMNNLIYKYIDSFKYYEKINKQIDDINKLIKKAKKELEESQQAADTPEVVNTAEAQSEVIDQAQADQMGQAPTQEANVPAEQAAPVEQQPEQVQESYTDNEFFNILKENGYAPTLKNLKVLKENLNDKYFIFNGEDDILEEDLSLKMEKYINKVIYKKSGQKNDVLAGWLGFLFSGPIGMILFQELTHEHNENIQGKYYDLYAAVQNDPVCQDYVDKIKDEINKEEPDKKLLREYKKGFAKEVQRVKSEVKTEKKQQEELPKISLKENFSDNELLDILKENKFAPTDKNIQILRSNPNLVLEEGVEDEN